MSTEARSVNNHQIRRCCDCGQVKSVEHFYARRRNDTENPATHWDSRCKLCRRIHRMERWIGGCERERYFQKTYGISQADYDAMAESQGGVCLICKHPPKRQFHVDHCHQTGAVRGLLCRECNLGIGYFRDRRDILLRALNYLDEPGDST